MQYVCLRVVYAQRVWRDGLAADGAGLGAAAAERAAHTPPSMRGALHQRMLLLLPLHFPPPGLLEPPRPLVLFDFSRADDAARWRASSDAFFGGRSRATWRPLPAERAAEFAGECSTALERGDADIARAGYCAATSELDPHGERRFDLDAYSRLVLTVRGDGHTYMANLRTDTLAGGAGNGDVWQAAFETRCVVTFAHACWRAVLWGRGCTWPAINVCASLLTRARAHTHPAPNTPSGRTRCTQPRRRLDRGRDPAVGVRHDAPRPRRRARPGDAALAGAVCGRRDLSARRELPGAAAAAGAAGGAARRRRRRDDAAGGGG